MTPRDGLYIQGRLVRTHASGFWSVGNLTALDPQIPYLGIQTEDGAAGIAAVVDITEASDAVASTAVLPLAATAAVGEAADTVSAAGATTLAAAVAITEAAETVAASCALQIAAVGEAGDEGSEPDIDEDSDVVAATATLAISSAESLFESDDAVSATGAMAGSESAMVTLARGSQILFRRRRVKKGFTVIDNPALRARTPRRTAKASVYEAGDTVASVATIVGRSRAARRHEEREIRIHQEAA